MFKFFKELIDSFKEGIAEGKAELAAEEAIEKEQKEILKSIPENISHEEMFCTAIAAPYRVTYFYDWFSLFKSERAKADEQYPPHLYTFGNDKYVSGSQKENLRDVLKRDFDIIDRETALTITSMFLYIANISPKLSEYESKINPSWCERWKKTTDSGEGKALISCIVAHVLTASADVGYLEKELAMEILSDVKTYLLQYYGSWQDFGDNFLEGNKISGLNNVVGKNLLSKSVGYLNEKKGSPWKNIAYNN